jgi:hypothetical protein
MSVQMVLIAAVVCIVGLPDLPAKPHTPLVLNSRNASE